MTRPAKRLPPGGVGDGLPAEPSGEPLLARWFVWAMLVLVPLAVAVTVWAFLSIGGIEIDAAERRPPGTAEVTHDRGDAVLGEDRSAQPGPGCAAGIEVVGDAGARAAGRVALGATCQLLQERGFEAARHGLDLWAGHNGKLRFAVFELTGVDASARLEDGRLVVELNAKFQFEDATRAAPVVLHELVHFAQGMPGAPVTAEAELAAMRIQALACERIGFRGNPPRGCLDARELLEGDDPLGRLRDAGYGD